MQRIFDDIEPRQAQLWGRHTVKLRHHLSDLELFSDESLAGLIDAIGADQPSQLRIETMPDEGYDVRAWSSCDRAGLPGARVLHAARTGRIWINMIALEKVDPRFGELLDQMYSELHSAIPDFTTFKRKLGLLISSPGARVFYHFDVPGQGLWQIKGRKRIWIYPSAEPFLQPSDVENTVRSVASEGLRYENWFDDHAVAYDMEPGDMLHWPLNGPHRVENYDTLNVSLTTEHWTSQVRRSYAMNYGNGILRSLALRRSLVRATEGPAFWAKAGLTAAWRISGMQKRQRYEWVPDYRVDPDAPLGVRPLTEPERLALNGATSGASRP